MADRAGLGVMLLLNRLSTGFALLTILMKMTVAIALLAVRFLIDGVMSGTAVMRQMHPTRGVPYQQGRDREKTR